METAGPARAAAAESQRKKTNPYRWAILAGYRDDLTIDRIDWRKGYCPENCRWATYSQQASNCHRDTEAYREACRRKSAKAHAAQKAKRSKRHG